MCPRAYPGADMGAPPAMAGRSGRLGGAVTPAWTVRTGRHGERDSWALDNALVGGGWQQIPDLTNVASREAMAELVTSIYGATEKAGAIPNYTGQLWALRDRPYADPTDTRLPQRATHTVGPGVRRHDRPVQCELRELGPSRHDPSTRTARARASRNGSMLLSGTARSTSSVAMPWVAAQTSRSRPGRIPGLSSYRCSSSSSAAVSLP